MRICQNIQEHAEEKWWRDFQLGTSAWLWYFSPWFGNWAWEAQQKLETSSSFSLYVRTWHACHRERLHMYGHASWRDICTYGREIWKNWPKPRKIISLWSIIIFKHLFVQALLKSGKTVLRETKSGWKHIWTILRTNEHVIRVRMLTGFLNVVTIRYAPKTMTIFTILLIANIPEPPEESHKCISQIKKTYLVSICIPLSKLLL